MVACVVIPPVVLVVAIESASVEEPVTDVSLVEVSEEPVASVVPEELSEVVVSLEVVSAVASSEVLPEFVESVPDEVDGVSVLAVSDAVCVSDPSAATAFMTP